MLRQVRVAAFADRNSVSPSHRSSYFTVVDVRKLGTSVTKKTDIRGNGKQPSLSQREPEDARNSVAVAEERGIERTFARAFIKLGHCRAVESVFLVSAELRRDKQLHGLRALFVQASPFFAFLLSSSSFLYFLLLSTASSLSSLCRFPRLFLSSSLCEQRCPYEESLGPLHSQDTVVTMH